MLSGKLYLSLNIEKALFPQGNNAFLYCYLFSRWPIFSIYIGSTFCPSTKTSKCTCGPVLYPLLPTKLEGVMCVCPDEWYEGFFVAKLRKKAKK